jgi:hypothetical protein
MSVTVSDEVLEELVFFQTIIHCLEGGELPLRRPSVFVVVVHKSPDPCLVFLARGSNIVFHLESCDFGVNIRQHNERLDPTRPVTKAIDVITAVPQPAENVLSAADTTTEAMTTLSAANGRQP